MISSFLPQQSQAQTIQSTLKIRIDFIPCINSNHHFHLCKELTQIHIEIKKEHMCQSASNLMQAKGSQHHHVSSAQSNLVRSKHSKSSAWLMNVKLIWLPNISNILLLFFSTSIVTSLFWRVYSLQVTLFALCEFVPLDQIQIWCKLMQLNWSKWNYNTFCSGPTDFNGITQWVRQAAFACKLRFYIM